MDKTPYSSAGGAVGLNQSFNHILQREEDYNLYEQFNKGEKKNPLGPLFKVKSLNEENQPAYPLIARVISFKSIQHKVVEEVFHEANALRKLNSPYLLPIEGMCYNKNSNMMHILTP